MEQMLRRTWAEIDLDALTHNFKTLQSRVGEKTKLVGVVTHVFLGDPQQGYAVYARWMYDQMAA